MLQSSRQGRRIFPKGAFLFFKLYSSLRPAVMAGVQLWYQNCGFKTGMRGWLLATGESCAELNDSKRVTGYTASRVQK